MRVAAYDTLDPTRRTEANVLININRNPNAPIFSEQSYFITVQESVALGTNIRTLTATDNDGDTVTYEIIDQNTAGSNYAREYIFLTSNSGELIVKKSLVGIGTSQFTFTARARDRRYPERFGTASVTISIVRDQFRPQCQSSNAVTTITETRGVNETFPFYTVGVTDGDLKVEIATKLKFGFNFQNLCESIWKEIMVKSSVWKVLIWYFILNEFFLFHVLNFKFL